jgi:hypothetical protein
MHQCIMTDMSMIYRLEKLKDGTYEGDVGELLAEHPQLLAM